MSSITNISSSSSPSAAVNPYTAFFLSRYTTDVPQQQVLSHCVANKAQVLAKEAIAILNSNKTSFGSLKDQLTPQAVLDEACLMNEKLPNQSESPSAHVDEAALHTWRRDHLTNQELVSQLPSEIAKALDVAKATEGRAKFLMAIRRDPENVTTLAHTILGLQNSSLPIPKINEATLSTIQAITKSYYEQRVLEKYAAIYSNKTLTQSLAQVERELLKAEVRHIIISHRSTFQIQRIRQFLLKEISFSNDREMAEAIMKSLISLNKNSLGSASYMQSQKMANIFANSVSSDQLLTGLTTFFKSLESMDDSQILGSLAQLQQFGAIPKDVTAEEFKKMIKETPNILQNDSTAASFFLKSVRRNPTDNLIEEVVNEVAAITRAEEDPLYRLHQEMDESGKIPSLADILAITGNQSDTEDD